ncbi:MAG: heme exporter protein CcmD [Burkholderiales bacterium]|nr:heme exporter protein CcmD [Burkholderiales bacterium]
MNWGSLEAFLAMGGYAFYVWGAYAVTIGLIAAELALAFRRHRTALRETRGARDDRGAAGEPSRS